MTQTKNNVERHLTRDINSGKLRDAPKTHLADRTDESLVTLVQEGSEAAFAELTRRYMQKCYSIVYQMIGMREEARDLSQDIFVKIFSSIHTFRKGNRFFSWFYRITLNHCINYTRRKKVLAFIPFSEVFARTTEDSEKIMGKEEKSGDGSEIRRIVRSAVDRLPPKQKKVVVLCDMEGFRQEEAADILAVPVGTVRSRLHYARNTLKELLKDYISEIRS